MLKHELQASFYIFNFLFCNWHFVKQMSIKQALFLRAHVHVCASAMSAVDNLFAGVIT